MNLRISDRAQGDLEGIYAYITVKAGASAADRFLGLAKEATAFLSKNPFAGPHPRWASRHKSLRFWVISRTGFLIYYIPEENSVSIERVLSGRRDVRRIFELGLEEPFGETNLP